MKEFVYPDKEAIKILTDKLKLKQPSDHSQDWEYESADMNRVEEFLDYYLCNDLSSEEKFALMLLMLASLDDMFSMAHIDTKLWEKFEHILYQDYDIHKNTIDYWACGDEPIEDCYSLTPFMRKFKKQMVTPK